MICGYARDGRADTDRRRAKGLPEKRRLVATPLLTGHVDLSRRLTRRGVVIALCDAQFAHGANLEKWFRRLTQIEGCARASHKRVVEGLPGATLRKAER